MINHSITWELAEMKFSGLTPDLKNEKFWSWNPAICSLTISPGDSYHAQVLKHIKVPAVFWRGQLFPVSSILLMMSLPPGNAPSLVSTWTYTFLSRLGSKVQTPCSTHWTELTTLHLCSPKASSMLPPAAHSCHRLSLCPPSDWEPMGARTVSLISLPSPVPFTQSYPFDSVEERKCSSGTRLWWTKRMLREIN